MIPLGATTPIGELARDHPRLIPSFERLGLDHCCHGEETLAEACRRAGADLTEVLAALLADSLAEPRGGDPADAPSEPLTMSALCDEIESTHHVRAREAFERLGPLLERVIKAHGAAHPEFTELAATVAGLRAEMLDHMVREERVLFPWLRRLEAPHAVKVGPPWSVRRPIDCMRHDHESVGAALARIRTLTSGYTVPPDACGSVATLFGILSDLERDTKVHIHKENNILFPAGVRAEAAKADAIGGGRP